MGVTITVAIMAWLSMSFVEYKIITAVPRVEPVFRGLSGIIISLIIGSILGAMLGVATGAGWTLGQMMGLATNRFTFDLYTGLARINRKRVEVQNNVKQFKHDHPSLFAEMVGTIRAGIKTIVAIVLAIIWIIGIPYRLYTHASNFYHYKIRKEPVLS